MIGWVHDTHDDADHLTLPIEQRAARSEGSQASRAYGQGAIQERHRHRYEVNNDYLAALEARGLRLSGVWPEKQLVEIIELPDHPWFVADQFHPELRSRATHPHPLFREFVRAAMDHKE